MSISNIVIGNIKKIRREKQFSQDYMAAKLNITQPTYSDIENIRSRFPFEKIELFAEILESPIEALFKGIDSLDDTHKHIEDRKLHENLKSTIELYKELVKSKDEIIKSKDLLIAQLLKKNKVFS